MMNEPHGSRGNDDIYDDLDSLFIPKPICGTSTVAESSSKASDFPNNANIIKSASSHPPSTPKFCVNEDQLKKEEMILYLELVVNDMNHKKELLHANAEYIKQQNEIDSLRKLLSEKDEKISRLTIENVTLKKNICSLYKTAKSEIEQKDILLQEANRRIDKMYSWSDRNAQQNEQSVESSQQQPSTFRTPSAPIENSNKCEADFKSKEGDNYNKKRKRSYEASEMENPAFSRPSTSSKPPVHKSYWNRTHSRHRYSPHKSDKYKHSSSRENSNEKYNSYNSTDRRNYFKKSESNQKNERKFKKQRLDR